MNSITEKLTNTISSLVSKLTGGNGPPGGGPGGGGNLNNSFTHMNLDDSILGLGMGGGSSAASGGRMGASSGAGMP
jgi:hypothetical protein